MTLSRKLRAPLTLLACLLFSHVSAQANNKALFQSAWKNKPVVLKQSLYSIVHGEAVIGVLIASQDKGVYYNADLLDLSDSDVNRLLAKVNAKTGSPSSQAQLLTYESGTKMIVKDVGIGPGFGGNRNRRVVISLYDEFAKGGSKFRWADAPTTTLRIEMPAKLSGDFSEREQVEAILLQYLHVNPNGPPNGEEALIPRRHPRHLLR